MNEHGHEHPFLSLSSTTIDAEHYHETLMHPALSPAASAPISRYPPPLPEENTPTSISFLLPVFIVFFVFSCLLSVFLFRDILHNFSLTRRSPAEPAPANSAPPPAGLDPSILASFPTLPYTAVRSIQQGKCGSECAVCLAEFTAGDVMRLLTVCCHAFHQECIDDWLLSHTTCPMCRSNLEAPPDEAAVMAVQEAVGGHSHVLDIEEGGEAAAEPGSEGMKAEQRVGEGEEQTAGSEQRLGS